MSDSYSTKLSKVVYNGKISFKSLGLRNLPKINHKHSFDDIYDIDLSDNNFTSIPETFCEYYCLQCLNCSHNLIRNLPASISNLIFLEKLDLSCNHLTSLAPSICKLEYLKVLIISSNRIVSLPQSIGMLSNLEEFDTSCNSLTCLPEELSHLQKLRILNVRHNKLLDVPNNLYCVPLEYLDLSENQLTSIPMQFHLLDSLQYLYLHSNPMNFPPINVCNRGLYHIKKYLKSDAQRNRRNNYRCNDIKPIISQFPNMNEEDINHTALPVSEQVNINENDDNNFSTTENANINLTPFNRTDSGYNTINESVKQEYASDYDKHQYPPTTNPKDSEEIGAQIEQKKLSLKIAATKPATKSNLNVTSLIENANTTFFGGVRDDKSNGIELAGHFRKNRNYSSTSNSPVVSSNYRSNRYSSRQRILNNESASLKNWRSSLPLNKCGDNSCSSNASDSINVENYSCKHDVELSSQCVVVVDSQEPLVVQNRDPINVNYSQTNNNNIVNKNTIVSPRKIPIPRKESHTGSAQMNGDINKEVQDKIVKFHKIIEAQLHVQIPTKNLSQELSNGIYLCHLANILVPHSISTIHTPSPGQNELGKQKCRRNLENFLEACRRNGVDETYLFSIKDVLNCNPSCLLDMALTVDTLISSIRKMKLNKTPSKATDSLRPESSKSVNNIIQHNWRDILENPQMTLSNRQGFISRNQSRDESFKYFNKSSQNKNIQNRSFHVSSNNQKDYAGSTTLNRHRKSVCPTTDTSNNFGTLINRDKKDKRYSSKSIRQYSSEV